MGSPNLSLAVFVLTLIVVNSVTLIQSALPPKDPNSRQEPLKEPITLEDVLSGKFSAAGFGGSWAPGSDSHIRIVSGGTVVDTDIVTGENITIVDGKTIVDRVGEGQLAELTFSNDGNFILVEHGRTSLWRHSTLAKYDIYDKVSKNWTKLVPGSQDQTPQPQLQLVRWAPSKNALAFVFQNNIYYADSPNEAARQITFDGRDQTIFNGISDWVYEEEMFGSPNALWFSKDSSNLAFVKFDDTLVDYYQWPVYGEPGSRESRYPTYQPIRYPKAGGENPKVSMNIVALNGLFVVKSVKYPNEQDKILQYYIATATWANENQLILVNLNRQQNQSTWHLCSSFDATCKVIYSHTETNGWIDAHTPVVSKDGSAFLTLESVAQAGLGKSYTQIVSVTITPGGSSTPVTSGALSVDSILGWDEVNKKVYFSGTGYYPGNTSNSSDPSESHIYFVADSGVNTAPECITCAQKNNAGIECRSNTVSFSSKFTYYTHSCKGPDVPEITTKKTQNHEVIKTWVDNNAVRTGLNSKAVPLTLDFDVPLASGFVAKVRLYVPADFDKTKKYPLLIDVYAGPDSQRITQDYKFDWGTSLVSKKGIIYGSIDGRGSGRQSSDLKFTVNRNLGSAEIEDQIAATKYLIEKEGFIDANRTAIWGWSYGGYATAMVLGKDTENVFKCGISVAPVTSWLYYDTIYTERYMGLPSDEDNWKNYNASSVMNHIDNLRNKQFLLIHGNADDNVHYQQSMMLTRALERADIMFNLLSYPDENHSIGSAGMRRHLYHSIEKFLDQDCFMESADPRGDDISASAVNTNNLQTLLITLAVILSYKQLV